MSDRIEVPASDDQQESDPPAVRARLRQRLRSSAFALAAVPFQALIAKSA